MSHILDDASYKSQKAAVWKATGIMAVVTIAEVLMAIYAIDILGRTLINLLFIIMSLGKAYYIVGIFMHLKYETNAFILSILMPLLFFIWFLIAFMMEGVSWLEMRNMF